jgi:hypothetical protein
MDINDCTDSNAKLEIEDYSIVYKLSLDRKANARKRNCTFTINNII